MFILIKLKAFYIDKYVTRKIEWRVIQLIYGIINLLHNQLSFKYVAFYYNDLTYLKYVSLILLQVLYRNNSNTKIEEYLFHRI